jgi:hypothetical protein
MLIYLEFSFHGKTEYTKVCINLASPMYIQKTFFYFHSSACLILAIIQMSQVKS